MNRREFLQNSCTACLAASALAGIISSCQSTRYIKGTLGTDGITIDINEFILQSNGRKSYRSFLIVRNEALQYPICVYRLGANEFSALWMSCTHQGTELQASGDRLQCSAHGSEFSSRGAVSNGPADRNLRSFPISINNDQLFIDLRAV